MKIIPYILLFIFSASLANARDIVQKKSGERIYGKIDGVDSASVNVIVLREGGNPTRSAINKSDIEFFEYDYNESELLEAPKIENKRVDDPDYIFSIGLFQGSNTIGGCDLEYKICDYIGMHAGYGHNSSDAAVNIHFSPSIRSSCLSLQIHSKWFFLGEDITFVPTFIYRYDRWFTAQIGFRIPVDGHNVYYSANESNIASYLGPVYLSVGAYIPW